MEAGFFSPERGYVQVVGDITEAMLAGPLEGYTEVPLRPGDNHDWDGAAWVHNPPAVTEAQVRGEAARRLEALAAGYTRAERESWPVQIAEAAAVQAGGDATAAPMLAALATARGITLAEMATRVQALSAQLTTATATILAAQATLLAMAPIPQDFTADTWWA